MSTFPPFATAVIYSKEDNKPCAGVTCVLFLRCVRAFVAVFIVHSLVCSWRAYVLDT